ncbi:MAG TPA: hypothetical protein VGC40_12960 [Paenirhodobacter sp.]
MKQINLAGIVGNASINVLSAGMSADTTAQLTAPDASTASAAYILDTKAERICTPLSVTASGGWNGSSFGAGFAPGVLSNFSLVQNMIADRVILSGLDYYTTYAPAMYEGAEVEFRRISNGQMVHVGTAKMTQVRFPLRALLPSASTQAISGTTFRHKLDSWNRRNVPYWYAVSAIGADGKMGIRSPWASYVATGTDSEISVPTAQTVTIPSRAEGGTLPAPALTLTAIGGVTVDLSWSAVSGAAGYVVWLAYNDPATWPDTVGEFRLQALQGNMPQTGDMVIWRKEVLNMTPEMFCARVHGASSAYSGLYPSVIENALVSTTKPADWEIRTWAENEKPAEDLGRYYLRRTIPAGAQAADGIYWSGGAGQTYYHRKKQGEVLVVDVWIRASKPVTLRFTSGQPGEVSQSFVVGTDWQKYHLTSDFAPEPTGTSAYRWVILAPAGDTELTVEYAQLRVRLGGSDYGALRPELAQSLLPGQKIRDHSLIKTRPATYTAKTVTNPVGEGYKGRTCGQHMDLCRTYGATPWVQLEWALFKEDWLLWAEWLAENHADFDTIMLELGNENWNSISAFWTLYGMKDATTGETISAGAVYGLMTRMVYGWLQESPFWSVLADKIEMVLGGHLLSAYGEQAYARCPEAKYVMVASYNGGWDTGTEKPEETGAAFRRILSFAGGEARMAVREAALAEIAATLGKTVGTDVFHDIYEAGPGYQMNGLNGASMTAAEIIAQECVVKSRAAAAAQVDAICAAWKRGWLSNWFVLGRGNYWTSHSNEYVEYLTHAAGRMIGESMGASFRIHDIHPLVMTTQDSVDDIAIYAFESLAHPGRWLLAVLNRAIDRSVLAPDDPLYDAADTGLRPVTIHTGFRSATGCRVFQGGLGNMRAHNRYPVGTRLTTDGTYAADPLCVSFDMEWHDVVLPTDIGQLAIDATFGTAATGLRGGNFVLIELSGMSRS